MLSCPILTYHSQNIRGNTYAENDHVALAADLRELHSAGFSFITLDRLVDALDQSEANQAPGMRGLSEPIRPVVLTFDDGCDFDIRDLLYPGHGPQRSFGGILQDFRYEIGEAAQPGLTATSFVIASSAARRVIDAGSLFGKGWISDSWWQETDRGSLISVENHGWDHNHPDLAGNDRGGFHVVDTHEQCLEQVVRAASAIEAKTGRWPRYFAYPFGESSAYIRETFFPEHHEVHGCRAALGTDPGPVTRSSNRWNLPRYVCGRDWNSTDELRTLINE